jgi:aryl-alcohol dehydrogenase-like predicted oxidoreductase
MSDFTAPLSVSLPHTPGDIDMRYNQMGNTGLKVSELCLGTMTFGEAGADNPMWGAIAGLDQTGVDAIMKRAIDAGINLFDTANVYSAGVREEMLGKSLKNLGIKRTDAVIATKFSERWARDRMTKVDRAGTSWTRSMPA